jgi:hypothetical protein
MGAPQALLNAQPRRYESIKRLSDSEVITLALFQQLRGVESERSILRDCTCFFSAVPRCYGDAPLLVSPEGRQAPRRFVEPLRGIIVPELVGESETMVDSTLLEV